MPQVNIYLDEEENAKLKWYMKKNNINSKFDAIRKIVREIKIKD